MKNSYLIILNLLLLLIFISLILSLESLLISDGDPAKDQMISITSFAVYLVLWVISVLLVNAFFYALKGYKSLFFSSLGFALLIYFVGLYNDRALNRYFLTQINGRPWVFCKIYSLGRGKGRVNLSYYAIEEKNCQYLKEKAPHYREDFSRAKEFLEQLNKR